MFTPVTVRDLNNMQAQERDLAALADTLLGTEAVQRFQALISAWRDYSRSVPKFKLKQNDPPIVLAAKYFDLGTQLHDTVLLRKFLSWVAFIECRKRLQKLATGNRIPKGLIPKAYQRTNKSVSLKSFSNRLAEAHLLNNNCGGLIVFLPLEHRAFATPDARIQSYLAANPHHQALLQAGEEFLTSILTDVEYPKRIWETNPFNQNLPFEHQVALLRIKSSDLPREVYQLDHCERIILSVPLSGKLPPSRLERISRSHPPPSSPLFVSQSKLPDANGNEADDTEGDDVVDDIEANDIEDIQVALQTSYPRLSPYTPGSVNPTLPSGIQSHISTPQSFDEAVSSSPLKSSPTLVAPTPQLDKPPRAVLLLDERTWLNDKDINGYMGWLTKEHNICFLNSHFLNQYEPDKHKWKSENGDPLKSDLVLMPINDNHHWYLMVMYRRSGALACRTVSFLDSLEGTASHDKTYQRWLAYLEAFGWKKDSVELNQIKVPQQTNGCDCGVYVLAFAENIAKNPSEFAAGPSCFDWRFNAAEFRRTIAANATISGPVDRRTSAPNKGTDSDVVIDVPSPQFLLKSSKRREDSSAPISDLTSPAYPYQDQLGEAVVQVAQCAPSNAKRQKISEASAAENARAGDDVPMTDV